MWRHASRRPVRSAPAAFTLIELLVVISVIAVLMGILLPALGAARENAKRLKCLTNLKGIGMGLSIYMSERSKGLLPKVRPLQGDEAKKDDPGLLDVLKDFVDAPTPRKQGDVFIVADPYKCPSDKIGSDKDGNAVPPLYESNGTSYQYWPGVFMLGAEMFLVPPEKTAFAVTKAYEKWAAMSKTWVILADGGDFHKLRKTGLAQNGLYFSDYRADWAVLPKDTEAEQFFADVMRFGGMNP